MRWIIPGILVSYIIGSIPTAYIFGRVSRGIDIRKFGSGNVGATNALRVLGKGLGIIVLVLDILKGFLPVILLGRLVVVKVAYISEEILLVILGLSCICGHNWTIFLKFRGGKGIATSFGVLLALALKIGGLEIILLLCIFTWIVVFFVTRIISLASILTGISLPIYMTLFRQSSVLILTSIILSIFIILRHKSNLKRILQGKESRLF